MATKDTTLRIVVSAEDRTEKALSNIKDNLRAYASKTENLNKTFGQMAKVGTATILGISTATLGAVKVFANAGDALGEMSIKTGISVKSLSELQYALEQNDTDIETFGVGILRMSKFMDELKSGSDGAVNTLSRLGLQVENVVGQTTEETFLRLGEAVAAIQDPMQRAAIATEIFGKQGQNLLPFLEAGRTNIDALRKKAQELGIVLSDDAAAAGDLFNNTLNTLKQSTRGLAFALGNIFLPSINNLVQGFSGAIIAVKDFATEHPRLVSGIVGATIALAGLVTVIGIAGKAFLALRAAAVLFHISMGPVGIALAAIGLVAGVVGATISSTSKTTDQLSSAMKNAGGVLDKTGDSFYELGKKAEETKTKIAGIRKEIVQIIDEYNQREGQGRKDIGELFVEQEKKVADIEDEIDRKKSEMKKARREDDAGDRVKQLRKEISDLQIQYDTERQALQDHQGSLAGLEMEYREARRRAQLTEFERRLEDILLERKINQENSRKRIEEKIAEMAELKKQEVSYTEVVRQEENARVAIVEDATSRIISSMSMRTANSTPSLGLRNSDGGNAYVPPSFTIQPRASGGPVAMRKTYLVGEQGPELFTPNSNGAIVPNHKISGGGVVVNINGGYFLSEDVAERIGDLIIRRLKLSNSI